MRYCAARYKSMVDERLYRIYVTDTLKSAFGIEKRYAEIFIPAETRTPEEIISNISAKLGQIGGEESG